MATKTNRKTRGASSSSSSPPAKRQKITVAPFVVAFPRRTRLSSTQWVNNVPFHVWVSKILNPFLDLKALSTVGRCNTFFEELWQYVLKQNIIRVPEDFPTMNQGMDMAVVFSERNECTPENPVRVVVGEGQFAVVGRLFGMTVSCSHITFVGKGKGKTTMLGGFQVDKQQHVKFEKLAVTNHRGYGLYCTGGGTNVDVTECCFKHCKASGLGVMGGATATATRCDFMENGQCGCATMECTGWLQILMLSWIFMVQKWTSVPTKKWVCLHTKMLKSTFICLPTTIQSMTTWTTIELNKVVAPSRTSTPTAHSHM